MFGFPGRAGFSPEERAEVEEYLRDALRLIETLDGEYEAWLEIASEDKLTLSIQRDPDGQHAALYLWRVSQPAEEFVQREPVRPARRLHEAYSLCLEARGAAADRFKEAADLALIKDPNPLIAEANRKLVEARRERDRASAARKRIEAALQGG